MNNKINIFPHFVLTKKKNLIETKILLNFIKNSEFFNITNKLESADIVICYYFNIIKTEKKMIIFDFSDSCNVFNNIELNNEKVIMVIKYNYFNIKYLNSEETNYQINNFLLYKLNKIYGNPYNNLIKKNTNTNYNNKVKLLFPGFHLFKRHLNDKYLSLTDRKIDVFYSGQTIYPVLTRKLRNIKNVFNKYILNINQVNEYNLITYHRNDMKNKLYKMKNKYDGKLNIYILDKKLAKEEYLKLLGNVKIFVSPFGYGECSLKDYESTLNGCLLIKPCDWLKSYPDIYQNSIKVKTDWSDLENVILETLDNIENKQKLVDNNYKLFKKYDFNKCSNELNKEIIESFKN